MTRFDVLGDTDRQRAYLLLAVCVVALVVFVAFAVPSPWTTGPVEAALFAAVVFAGGVWEVVLDDAFTD